MLVTFKLYNDVVVMVLILGTLKYQVFGSTSEQLTSTTLKDLMEKERRIEGYPQITQTCESVCEYDDWYQRAKCNNRGLRLIPNSIGCEEAHMLELHENVITNITSYLLSGYGNIETLDLSHNKIASVKPGTFDSTRFLENIFLSANLITELENGTFKGTEHHLVRLFLDNNKLTEIHPFALRKLRKLKTLTFSNNKLTFLPENVFSDLAEMQYLHLTGNRLTYLDSNIFSGCSQLRSISIDRNYLTVIPAALLRGLTSLRSMDLSYNHIKSIPSPIDLGIHNNLQTLNLCNNRFTSSATITTYIDNTGLLVICGSNPFECDCSFQRLQDWFNRQSGEKRNLITSRSPLECKWNASLTSIDDDLSSVCLVLPTPTLIGSPVTSQEPIPVTGSTTSQVLAATSSTTRRYSDQEPSVSSLDYERKPTPETLRNNSCYGKSSDTVNFELLTVLGVVNICLVVAVIVILTRKLPEKNARKCESV
ncbi:Leucine-rich repeat-containing protein 15 [Apostichopus japonicus]|uniref:Leucine-rich repeat-containing protein 15 n=1 Tax=Stichopus japonicus TaxID=307972 RepID=A0A2G8L7U1_STIJA|nr:Leucine-rich repeat-containing protein 15 [Apostichopus japonicus]